MKWPAHLLYHKIDIVKEDNEKGGAGVRRDGGRGSPQDSFDVSPNVHGQSRLAGSFARSYSPPSANQVIAAVLVRRER